MTNSYASCGKKNLTVKIVFAKLCNYLKRILCNPSEMGVSQGQQQIVVERYDDRQGNDNDSE